MRIGISVDEVEGADGGVPEDELRSLHAWLLADPAARRYARPELTATAPSPGDMGTLFDVVSLVVGSGFSAGSLAVSIAQWRGTRPRTPTVTVRRLDGHQVTISGATPQEAARLVRLVEAPGTPGQDPS